MQLTLADVQRMFLSQKITTKFTAELSPSKNIINVYNKKREHLLKLDVNNVLHQKNENGEWIERTNEKPLKLVKEIASDIVVGKPVASSVIDILPSDNLESNTQVVQQTANSLPHRTQAEELEELYKIRVNAFLRGMSGTGKSAVVKALAKKYNKKCIIRKLAGMAPEDWAIPKIFEFEKDNKTQASFRYGLPEWVYELEDGDIIFIDELPQGSPQVLNTIFSISDEEPELEGFQLPDIWVVAAGNFDEENSGQSELPLPVVPGRYVEIQWKPDVKFLTNFWNIKESQVKELLKTGCNPRAITRAIKMMKSKISLPIIMNSLTIGKSKPAKCITLIDTYFGLGYAFILSKFEKANIDKTGENEFK